MGKVNISTHLWWMKDILDDFQKKERPIKSRFSKFSFAFAFIALVLFTYGIFLFYEIKNTTLFPQKYIIFLDPFVYLGGGILIFCLIGTILSILSYLRAEPANFYKIGGALLNFFLLSLVLMGIFFSKFL